MATHRPDRDGTHRLAFERAKKKIYATRTVCGICGLPVDFERRFPHPLSPCIDHIIPVAKGGHPSDLENLQLAHFACNRQKSDKLLYHPEEREQEEEGQELPQSTDWAAYRSKGP
ncbi:MAG: HNH endonuclease [Oscillospiraceae bacterium]|nr:HNH endonuclease [Oscillospiraceae bacterium]